MEQWSDQPLGPFRVKFFLDTNILCDLVCNTYSGLNFAIDFLNNCPFVDLVASRYVIFEFLDVRKKMLYQDEVRRMKLNKADSNRKWWEFWTLLNRHKPSVDANSLVRYKEEFKSREVNFHIYKQFLLDRIKADIEKLRNLEINFDNNILHDNLLAPTKDINLQSKLSREDSIVSVSSIWPEDSLKEKYIILLTRDKPFVDAFSEIDLTSIFANYGLNSPIIEHVRDLKLTNGTKVNLADSNDDGKLNSFLPTKLKELILTKNQSLFLGKTFSPSGVGFPIDAVCFKLQPNTSLDQNIYLTIIGKDLDFIYSVKCSISHFYNNGPIAAYPFSSTSQTNISFTPKDNSSDLPMSLDASILNKLREDGNLVFINPDGMI